jgi:hypothetical protein
MKRFNTKKVYGRFLENIGIGVLAGMVLVALTSFKDMNWPLVITAIILTVLGSYWQETA